MAADLVYDLLIVSDLHLSEGRNPQSKKISLNEDFFFDDEFSRFLQYHSRRMPGRKWNLIFNGDFLDFLQVISEISEDSDRDFLTYLGVATREAALKLLAFDRGHPECGLGTGPKETVYKLWKIMAGHWVFFEAIADFIVQGNVVTIGRGNHDVEFIYTEVRNQFAPKLRRMYQEKLGREHDPEATAKLQRFDAACSGGAIRFMDWFYYEPGVLWVEHGNQYDELNSFKYWLAPYLPKGAGVDPQRQQEIDLPWGSFFVRYLFNKIETKEPFADNVKPQSRFIRWFLTTHPRMALGFLFGDGRYMVNKMARAWRPVADDAYADRAAEHQRRLEQLARESHAPLATLLEMDRLGFRSPNILKEPYGSWYIGRWLTRTAPLMLLLLGLILFAGAAGAIFIMVHILLPILPTPIRSLGWHYWNALVQHSPWALKALDAIRSLALIIFLGLIGLYLKSRFGRQKPTGSSLLASRAEQIRQMLDVKYVTMGHTHETDLQRIGGRAQEYFNTGTWTKVFSDQEDRLIREESELVFLQVVHEDNDVKVRLLKWEDGPGEPRLVKLFDKQGSALQQSSVGAPK